MRHSKDTFGWWALAGVVAAVIVMWAMILMAVFTSAAGAQTTDHHCVRFDGTRLLNQDGNDTGPISDVFIPAGDYLIELTSVDDSHPDSPTQPSETWLLVFNGNLIVGPSEDIADHATTSVVAVGPVTLPDVETVQSVHARIGENVNSVDPVSACFFPVATPEPLTPTEPEPTVEPEPTREVVPERTPEQPATAPEDPAPQTPADPEPDPELPPELAVTGLGTNPLWLAVALIAAGTAALAAERRTARRS